MTALDVPTVDAEAILVAAWPDLGPKLIAAARHKFLRSPWAHEAHERAEEEAHDAFVKCLTAAREGRWDGANVAQFVSVVGAHEVTDTLRRQKWAARKAPDGGEDPAAAAAEAMADALTPEAIAVHADAEAGLRGLLGVAMEALPTRHRRALWLQVYGGLSNEALGQTLGVTTAAAKSLLFRAREALRSGIAWDAKRRARGSGAVARLARMTGAAPGPDACWPWLGAYLAKTQPALHIAPLRYDGRAHKGTVHNALRVRWALAHGPIPPWVDVVSTCRVLGCTNPAHAAAGPALRQRPVPLSARPDVGAMAGRRVPSGPELRARRLAAGLMARQVGELAGCSARHLEYMEREAPTQPRGKYRPRPARRLPARQRYLDLRRRVDAVLPAVEACGPADLRRRREALGLSPREMAAAAGCAYSTLRRMETGWMYRAARERGGYVRPMARPAMLLLLAALDRLERERAEGSAA